MSKVVGKLLTCDRCGTTEFLPYVSTKELDGGYTRADNFEAPKEPWSSEDFGKIIGAYKFIDLCPSCSKEFLNIKMDFIEGCQK